MESLRSLTFDIGWDIGNKVIKEADQYTDRLKDSIIGASGSMDQLGSRTENTTDEIKLGFRTSEKIIDTTADSIEDADEKMDDLGDSVDKASKKGKKGFGLMNDAAGKLGTTLAGIFTVGAIVSFGDSMADSASSLEGYRNTLNIVMKDQVKAAQTMSWAVEFANRTPFETDSIVESTVRLQSYGIEAKKVLPAIGDMAGVMNKDIMQAVEAVADAQTGELERLKEFGITKQMIIDHGNKIMKGKQIVNNKGQIVDQEKFNKALFSLMEDRFKGGMEIQANSYKGIVSTIKGVWATGLAQMAGISAEGEIKVGSFFDVLKEKSKEFSGRLTEMANDGTFEEISESLGRGLVVVIDGFETFGEVIGFVNDNSEILIPLLGGLSAGYASLNVITFVTNATKAYNATMAFSAVANASATGSILGVNTALIAQRAIMIHSSIVAKGLWATMLANPIVPVIAGITALVGVVIYLYRNWDRVTESIQKAWNWLTKWNDKEVKPKQTEYGYVGVRDSVPGFANGVTNFRGGVALVGERGPELVTLERGSNVIPNELLRNIPPEKSFSRQRNGDVLTLENIKMPDINIVIQGNDNPEETAKATRSELERMFPNLIEEFFEMLARKHGLVLD
ncbi:hypothetical protein [Anaerosolibacter sp.]|uniref:hypothetical protein n=1 Tax=Anaerosolibacter sp. TaxID=1872527 RepID=UPI0039EE43E7